MLQKLKEAKIYDNIYTGKKNTSEGNLKNQ